MIGSLAEWSKALASGASLERGVGSNPTALNFLRNIFDLMFFTIAYYRLAIVE